MYNYTVKFIHYLYYAMLYFSNNTTDVHPVNALCFLLVWNVEFSIILRIILEMY